MSGLYITQELMQNLTTLRTAYLNEDGREVNNPAPIAYPGRLDDKPSLQDQIKRLLRIELSRQMAAQGHETFDEANDFDVDSDPEPFSPFEIKELIPETPDEPAPQAPPPPPRGGGAGRSTGR